MMGEESLQSVELKNNQTEQIKIVEAASVFVFIGATPRTNWLPEEIDTDEKGFIKTGLQAADSKHWRSSRQPLLLETSRAGVFAAGDVRLGSTKRVASVVGEGSMTVQLVHEILSR